MVPATRRRGEGEQVVAAEVEPPLGIDGPGERTAAMAPGPGAEPSVDPVHAPLDPLGASAADLVAERVGERLDRLGPADGVAVDVQQVMELAQRQGSVASEDGETGRPQAAAPQGAVIGGQERERSLVVSRWTATLVGLDDRPEQLSGLVERVEELDALLGEREQVGVELGEAGEGLVALHVQAHSLVAKELGGPAVRCEAVAFGGMRHGGHGVRTLGVGPVAGRRDVERVTPCDESAHPL